MSKLLSFRVSSLGMVVRLVIEAKMRSISIPLRTSLMIGTKESGTAVNEVTAPGPAMRSKMPGKSSKKSSRLTCLGATASVSISDPTSCQSPGCVHIMSVSLTWPEDPQAITSIGINLAAELVDLRLWQFLLPTDFADEFLRDSVQQAEGTHSLLGLFMGFIIVFSLQLFNQVCGLLIVEGFGQCG